MSASSLLPSLSEPVKKWLREHAARLTVEFGLVGRDGQEAIRYEPPRQQALELAEAALSYHFTIWLCDRAQREMNQAAGRSLPSGQTRAVAEKGEASFEILGDEESGCEEWNLTYLNSFIQIAFQPDNPDDQAVVLTFALAKNLLSSMVKYVRAA